MTTTTSNDSSFRFSNPADVACKTDNHPQNFRSANTTNSSSGFSPNKPSDDAAATSTLENNFSDSSSAGQANAQNNQDNSHQQQLFDETTVVVVDEADVEKRRLRAQATAALELLLTKDSRANNDEKLLEMKALLDAGADVNGRIGKDRPFVNELASLGDFYGVRLFVSRDDLIVDNRDRFGLSALLAAIRSAVPMPPQRRLGIVTALAIAGANPDGLPGSNCGSPLLWAMLSSHTLCAIFLINAGASLGVVFHSGTGTPLHQAVLQGSFRIAQLLIDRGAPVDAKRPEDGWTPLHVAVEGGHVGLVKLLLTAKANKNAITANGDTPLHMAIAGQHLDIVHILLAQNPSIGWRRRDRMLPFTLAATLGNLRILEALWAKVDGHYPEHEKSRFLEMHVVDSLRAAALGGHLAVLWFLRNRVFHKTNDFLIQLIIASISPIKLDKITFKESPKIFNAIRIIKRLEPVKEDPVVVAKRHEREQFVLIDKEDEEAADIEHEEEDRWDELVELHGQELERISKMKKDDDDDAVKVQQDSATAAGLFVSTSQQNTVVIHDKNEQNVHQDSATSVSIIQKVIAGENNESNISTSNNSSKSKNSTSTTKTVAAASSAFKKPAAPKKSTATTNKKVQPKKAKAAKKVVVAVAAKKSAAPTATTKSTVAAAAAAKSGKTKPKPKNSAKAAKKPVVEAKNGKKALATTKKNPMSRKK